MQESSWISWGQQTSLWVASESQHSHSWVLVSGVSHRVAAVNMRSVII